MPRLTVTFPKSPGVTGPGGTGGGWMEVQEDREGRTTERTRTQSAAQSSADPPPPTPPWSQAVRTLQPWCSLAPVGVVWSVCQLEALLHPSLSLLDVGCRLALVGLLWVILGCCIFVLRGRLRPGHGQEDPPSSRRQEAEAEAQEEERLWASRPRTPGLHVPLALALADSLLLCVLQEPLPDPRVPHIQALISRLKSVGDALERAGTAAGMTLEEVDRGSALTDRLKLICTYLQQRTLSLHALVQAQGDFEAGVRDLLRGLDSLWAQLEELHTGVTLTKEGSQGRVAVASAQTHAETLFAVLGRYRTKLQSCQAHLKESTELLQELTWSHADLSHRAGTESESVWPEALLQSNMEQFDRVQECFHAVEQQTSTFRAHLEGLGKATQNALLPAQTRLGRSNSVPHRAPRPPVDLPAGDAPLERRGSSSSSRSVEAESSASILRRSALQLSSTLESLRRSGRKK